MYMAPFLCGSSPLRAAARDRAYEFATLAGPCFAWKVVEPRFNLLVKCMFQVAPSTRSLALPSKN